MKQFFVTISVVAFLSIFLLVSALLFSELSFAQENCVGNPDAPVTWKECIIMADGSFFINQPQYGTEKDGFLPLHGLVSIKGGVDTTTPTGFCKVLKRSLVATDHRWNRRKIKTISLNNDGSYRGTYKANFYYNSITCKLLAP